MALGVMAALWRSRPRPYTRFWAGERVMASASRRVEESQCGHRRDGRVLAIAGCGPYTDTSRRGARYRSEREPARLETGVSGSSAMARVWPSRLKVLTRRFLGRERVMTKRNELVRQKARQHVQSIMTRRQSKATV